MEGKHPFIHPDPPPAKMSQLSIHLLGTFHVSYDGRMVDGFRTERERALLAYLAVERDRPHRRETLMGLLWPEQSEKRARNNLRVNLHRLRKTLEKATGEKDWLLVGRDSVQLNGTAAIAIDVMQFETHCQVAQRLAVENGMADPARLRHLKEVCRLYQGEFLQGFSFAHSVVFAQWATQGREQWHRRALKSLYELCAMHMRRGELAKAMPAARRQLELEPWREEAHCQVIEILARRGERSAALAQYEQCRTALREELGVEPGEQTKKLAHDIEQLAAIRVRNLPVPDSQFIGREEELDQITTYLSDPSCRLLTLTGHGGSGKTRLAIAAAQQLSVALRHGICYVSLSAIDDVNHIAPAILEGLGVPLADRVKPNTQLQTYLQERELLLVLDNCEQLLPDIRSVIMELLGAPQVKLLTTSRERMSIQNETVMVIDGLALRAEGTPISYSAGRLFLHHARRHRADFDPQKEDAAAIARICQALGGTPMALELAASWLSVLSLPEIAAEVEQDISFINAAPVVSHPARHQDMDVIFEHSWRRLSSPERRLFSKLSVFAAPFSRHAAEQVADATLSLLASLVHKSLLQRETTGDDRESHYALHPLLRHFAAEKLREDASTLIEAQRAFVDHFSRYLEQRNTLLIGPDHRRAMDEILAVYNNVRAAIRLACQLQDIKAIARMLFPLLGFTYMSSISLPAARQLFKQMAQAITTVIYQRPRASKRHQAILARALAYEAWFGLFTDDRDAAQEQLQQALPLAEESGDHEIIASILNALGIIARDQGDFSKAETLFQQALSRVDSSSGKYAWWQRGSFNTQLGISNLRQESFAEAKACFEKGRRAFAHVGSDLGENVVLRNLGDLALQQGDFTAARKNYEEALATTERLGSQVYQAQVLVQLGRLAVESGDLAQAEKWLQQAGQIGESLGASFILDDVHKLRGILEKKICH